MYIKGGLKAITLQQLELMAHTIGFDRKKIKYNKFKVLRNYFETDSKAPDFNDLEKLVELGVMRRKRFYEACQFIYKVNRNGFELFETLYRCKIVEVD